MAARMSLPRVLASFALLASACAEAPQSSPTAVSGRDDFRSTAPQGGRYLVGFDSPTQIPADVLAASGGRVVDRIAVFNVVVVDNVTNPDALWSAEPTYIEAGFDVYVDHATLPAEGSVSDALQAVPGATSAPWYANGRLWGMHQVEAAEAWRTTTGGAGVKVCIVDTGVDATHRELSPNVTLRANFVTSQPRVDDPNGHGSHVAGTAAGYGITTPGVAPRATILGARVLNTAGSGTESAIINGMNWCVDNGAHVINMSLGGARYRGQSSYVTSPITYGNAVLRANDQGVVVVTAAGNSNTQYPNAQQTYVPAHVPGTIIVGAVAPTSKSGVPTNPFNPFDPNNVWRGTDSKAYYSSYGPAVHVFGPGGRGTIPLSEPYRFVNGVAQGHSWDFTWSVCSRQVAGCESDGFYSGFAGTSMATPHVSGLAAVLYGELGGVRSAAARERVEGCIRSTTENIGSSDIFGGGRINVRKALDALRAGAC